MRHHILTAIFAVLTLTATEVKAGDHADLIIRAGYTIGGTTPLPLPEEIRSIDGFSPRGGFNLGLDVRKMLGRRWGINAGAHLFYEGFNTEASVKNYRMSLTMDGNTMSGYFTGENKTRTDMCGITIPVTATVRLGQRWNISVGPYVSFYFDKKFCGEVYDNADGIGYLRVDTPTGEKVNMDRNNPATYDFTDHMEDWNCGVQLVIDWHSKKGWGVYGKMDWGISNIMENDFDAIAFRMYPLYATIGISYKI